jgi:hypothetical protein
MRQFSEAGSIEVSKFNESIKFNTGDLVRVMVTGIKPSKSEQERVDSVTEIGGNWTEHADFREGMLFICTAVEYKKDGNWVQIVDYSDYENIKLPYGKFGYQFFHTINFGNMFGKEGGWPFRVSGKMQKEKSFVNVQYTIPSMPRDWDDWSPADRYDYWCSMASLMLNCGKESPTIIESGNGWTINQDTIHRLSIGDVTTALILKQQDKNNAEKFYTYLKTMVKNPNVVPGAKYSPKYIVKNCYDLVIPENSQIVAKAIYEAVNKENDPGEKDIFDKAVESISGNKSTDSVTDDLPF